MHVDFLLECIGFPPDHPHAELVELVLARGEPAAWRGDPARHRRLPLGGGLELRMDKEVGQPHWNLLPHYQVSHRLRIAVEEIRALPDSPFDALLLGWAAPYTNSDERHARPGAYLLATYLTDARKLPKHLPPHHVLAISVAGFALDVSYVGPDAGAFDSAILERDEGASIEPLGGAADPGGCAEVSLRVRRIRHLVNPITHIPVEVLEVDAPERPLELFLSQWQLERDGLPMPRPGWRIEGTFMFSGNVAGGLPGPIERRRGSFG